MKQLKPYDAHCCRCRKWLGVYTVSKAVHCNPAKFYDVNVCGQCLTVAERAAIDAGRREET